MDGAGERAYPGVEGLTSMYRIEGTRDFHPHPLSAQGQTLTFPQRPTEGKGTLSDGLFPEGERTTLKVFDGEI